MIYKQQQEKVELSTINDAIAKQIIHCGLVRNDSEAEFLVENDIIKCLITFSDETNYTKECVLFRVDVRIKHKIHEILRFIKIRDSFKGYA